MLPPNWFELIVVAAYGLLIGSFLNVVIHRVPRRLSIVRPRSFCPRCGTSIRWFRNIPVFSWLQLAGRCGDCREPISARYPLIELVAMLIATASYMALGLSIDFAIVASFSLVMLVLFMIDFDLQLLPFAITKPAVLIGILASPWNLRLHDGCLSEVAYRLNLESGQHASLRAACLAVIGATLGYALPRLLMVTWRHFRGVEGMGGGDPVMLAMIGAFVGPCGVIAVLLIGSLAGVVVGLTLIALRRADMQTALPFGCFLAPAAVAVMWFGADKIWDGWNSIVFRMLFS